MAFDR